LQHNGDAQPKTVTWGRAQWRAGNQPAETSFSFSIHLH
jgi:hypothetical protein